MKIPAAALTAVVYTASIVAQTSQAQPLQIQPSDIQEPRTGVSTPPPVVTDSTTSNGGTSSGTIDGYTPTPAAPAMQHRETRSEQRLEAAGAMEPATPPITTPRQDIDANIVTDLEHAANQCPVGTVLKARMNQTLSTISTPIGAAFSAQMTEPVQENGRTLIPAGSILEGRVTEVHGGKRIRGTAALHLEPRNLTLPDGTRYTIHGQVIDTSQSFATRIDSEGTIKRRDHIKTTLAGVGLATGGAVAAGAVLGGGVGALVGLGVGAGLGTAWWLKQDRQTVLPQDTQVVFSLNEPLMIGFGSGMSGGR